MNLVRIESGDNGPIWLNAGNVIAVENRRGDGQSHHCIVSVSLATDQVKQFCFTRPADDVASELLKALPPLGDSGLASAFPEEGDPLQNLMNEASMWEGRAREAIEQVEELRKRLKGREYEHNLMTEDRNKWMAKAENAAQQEELLLDLVRKLRDKGRAVMECLEEHGDTIVPHLIDTDDNDGEYFRAALREADAALGDEGNA